MISRCTSTAIAKVDRALRCSWRARASAPGLGHRLRSRTLAVDAVITDPPYYDNISYADLSDFFYVWLKRSIGHLYPEHLAARLTPKRSEAIAAAYRHDGDKDAARGAYEEMMARVVRGGAARAQARRGAWSASTRTRRRRAGRR